MECNYRVGKEKRGLNESGIAVNFILGRLRREKRNIRERDVRVKHVDGKV